MNNNSVDFKELMEFQAYLQETMRYPVEFGEAGAKEMLLGANVEVIEALDELNWKPWKPKDKIINRGAFTTELTDIIQFVFNAAFYMGISHEQLSLALRKKWVINVNRIKNGETI